MLTFAEYQAQSRTTAVYPGRDQGNITYPALGLAGESGEVCEKIKKCIRDDNGIVTPERRALLAKELGDVLWYVAALATELHLDLSQIAADNLAKLAARKANNRIHGDGDLR